MTEPPLTAAEIAWHGVMGDPRRHVAAPTPAAVKPFPSKAPPLELLSIGELLAEPDEAIEFVVDGLLAKGSVNVLSSKPKVGKSTLARALSFAVARQELFLGRRCPASGAVWYLAFEGSRGDIRKAFRTLGTTSDDPIRLFIGKAPGPIVAQVRDRAQREQPALIVVDTMQRFLRAKDMNDYSEMTLLFDHVIQIAQLSKAALLLLTHNAKVAREGLDAILGSTAIAGSVDTAILLTRSERYRTISTVQRTGDDLGETVLQMDEDGRVRLAGSRHLVDAAYLRQQFLDVLERAGAPVERTELLSLVEGRQTDKLKALKALVSGTSGTTNVLVTGAGKKNDPLRYCVSVPVVPHIDGNHNLFFPIDQQAQGLNPEKGGSRICTGEAPPREPPIRREPPSEPAPNLSRNAAWAAADARFKQGW